MMWSQSRLGAVHWTFQEKPLNGPICDMLGSATLNWTQISLRRVWLRYWSNSRDIVLNCGADAPSKLPEFRAWTPGFHSGGSHWNMTYPFKIELNSSYNDRYFMNLVIEYTYKSRAHFNYCTILISSWMIWQMINTRYHTYSSNLWPFPFIIILIPLDKIQWIIVLVWQ